MIKLKALEEVDRRRKRGRLTNVRVVEAKATGVFIGVERGQE